MRTLLMICVSMLVLMFVATGCYEVVYTVEWKGDSCIKFEDAMYWDDDLLPEPGYVDACLGEDGVQELDWFIIELDGPTDEVDITVKAGKCKDTVALEEDGGVWWGIACDFTIVGYPVGGGWYFEVISDTDNETAALSYVMFCFGDDVEVVGPPEEPYPIERWSEYDEPTEPEEPEDED